tara:strand:- start:2507 stop:5167 length:2661 start_codon:yes stop_codon:yes gene_type:complete
MADPARFNCGEFRPGKTPRRRPGGGGPPGGGGNTTRGIGTSGKIPGGKPPIEDGGKRPGKDSQQRPRFGWRCYEYPPVNHCTASTQFLIRKKIRRVCLECDGTEPPELAKKCTHKNEPICKSTCVDDPGQCGSGATTGGFGIGFGFRCSSILSQTLLCTGQGDTTLESGHVRRCEPCTQSHTGCTDLSDCIAKCKNKLPRCLTGTSQNPGGLDRDQFSDGGRFRGFNQIAEEAKKSSYRFLQPNPPKEIKTIDLNEEMKKALKKSTRYSKENNSIFHPLFNLTLTPNPFNDYHELVPNRRYLNIFKNRVSIHVGWLLSHLSRDTTWNEDTIVNLTLDHIAGSLDPILLAALDSLKFVGGTPINLETMLETIRFLLLSNRIDEFDPGYYKKLAKRHSGQSRIKYSSTNVEDSVKIQAALGLVAYDSFPADPEKAEPVLNSYLRRFRYLNEDINVAMPVLGCDGNTSGADLYNEGLQIVRLQNSNNANEQVSSLMELAEGGGYYLSATKYDNIGGSPTKVAVEASSDIDKSFAMYESTRSNSLNIINEDNSMKFTVTSTYETSEFGDSYDLATTFSPMFFILDLSTVGDAPTSNPVVSDTSATYKLTTDVDEINKNVRSHGYGVRILNIDYNDPFLVYVNNSESMTVRTKDITFNDFSPVKGSAGDSLFPRKIPFSIILTPGRGSSHNPLASMSEISSWETTVTRDLYIIPDINVDEEFSIGTALGKDLTYNVDGTFGIGLLEPFDIDSIIFNFDATAANLQNTYYSDDVRSSTMPTRTRTGVAVLLRRIDDIVSKYEIPTGKITWYDVWKRLSSTEFFDIQNTSVSAGFTEWLTHGGRGVKITKILNRLPLVITGLGDVKDESIEDTIYITNTFRDYDSTRDPPIRQ